MSSAASADSAVAASIFHAASWAPRIRRLVALSSTMSAFTLANEAKRSEGCFPTCSARANFTVNQKVVPHSGVLDTDIVPPMHSTS